MFQSARQIKKTKHIIKVVVVVVVVVTQRCGRNTSTTSVFLLLLCCSPKKESIPFAVIGSNTVVEAKGKRVRGRLYPWGIVEGTRPKVKSSHVGHSCIWVCSLIACGFCPHCCTVENSAHCDFVKLRNMLVRTHMQDLKDVTRETHYENYRAQCIQSMTRMVVKERNRKYAHAETHRTRREHFYHTLEFKRFSLLADRTFGCWSLSVDQQSTLADFDLTQAYWVTLKCWTCPQCFSLQ